MRGFLRGEALSAFYSSLLATYIRAAVTWLGTNSLIEFIVEHLALPGADVARLGPMAEYPPGAHVLVAVVTSLFGVNALRALFLSSIVAVFAGYFLVLNLLGGQNRTECFASAVLMIFFIALLRGTHMLFGNEIIHEYFFYAQLVGDLCFVFLLIVVSKIRQPTIVCVFSIVAVYALAWIYTASGIPSFRERPDFGAFRPSRRANGEP